MKYHTLSTSSLATEGKKSTLTLYTAPSFLHNKMDSTETAMIRRELEVAQRALKLQTRRCRELVSKYTRKLQDTEMHVISERQLRDEQLKKVLRSLLVFEARLKQEQTFIRHQLEEKDDLIQKQKKELRSLRLTVQYCKTCSQFYSGSNIDSCDSSSEYCIGSQDAWESCSEVYGSISECGRPETSSSGDENQKHEYHEKITYEKNKYNKIHDGSYKRCKKANAHRRTTGTYFEVLKLRESNTESSLEEASDISDTQMTKEKIKEVSERIEEMFAASKCDDTFSERMDNMHGIKRSPLGLNSLEDRTTSSLSGSDFDTTVLSSLPNETNLILKDEEDISATPEDKKIESEANPVNDNLTNEEKELSLVENNTNKSKLITDTIPVFDAGEGEANDNWYASASDQEDDEQRDMYRNNPVLECMNQILLQNINDPINSPPKTPELERNAKLKPQKRVKFSDENKDMSCVEADSPNTSDVINSVNDNMIENNKNLSEHGDYYETPIQGGTNFYEVPQSIYSNDYEQILSKCGDSVHSWSSSMKAPSPTSKFENLQENKINRMATQKLTLAKSNNLEELEQKSHYYIDMSTRSSTPVQKQEIIKRIKVARTPPALPPKPANLVSKFKIQNGSYNRSSETLNDFSIDSEPDYCSISELNLPTEKMIMSKTHSFIKPVEANTVNTNNISIYDPISLDETLSNLVARNVEKNGQSPKPPIKNERIVANVANIAQISMLKNKKEPEIPKLPQVSEIIIPEETEEKQKEHISQDNYIKNNSQLLKQKTIQNDKLRSPIVIGTSVSSLVSNFNNHLLPQTRKFAAERANINEKLFSNFEYSQSYEKRHCTPEKPKTEIPSFEKFDLSQNFEEFNLDDCEIGEDYQSDTSSSLNYNINIDSNVQSENIKDMTTSQNELDAENRKTETKSNTSVEIVRATKDIHPHSVQSLQHLQKCLSSQRNSIARENEMHNVPAISRHPEPSYEHFLECTGLSSKSILTPSRMLSNHKSVLKPKDIKLRSKVKSTAVFEHSGGTVKYWSEPYL